MSRLRLYLGIGFITLIGVVCVFATSTPQGRHVAVVPNVISTYDTPTPQSHDVFNYTAPTCNHEVAALNDLVRANLAREPHKLTEITNQIIAVAEIGQLCGIRLDLYDLGIVRSDRLPYGTQPFNLNILSDGPNSCFWSPTTGFIGQCRYIGFLDPDADDDDHDDHDN